MSYVLLAIDPKWSRAILSGSKEYEYRRSPPVKSTPFTMFLYATDPVKAIVGHTISTRRVEGTPQEIIEETIEDTPHDREDIEEYLSGAKHAAALSCEAPWRYAEHITLDELRNVGIKAPQNFRYVDEIPEEIAGKFPDDIA